ncbi:DNA-binding pseudobarrel domain superfamily [Forsythia ovata]|uniref:DNA-binding pseudobarrel domain superfamily n=1 Tax=Forsythia ovata TaxID=205694 RepID=A0ABD1WTV6_9LAMI
MVDHVPIFFQAINLARHRVQLPIAKAVVQKYGHLLGNNVWLVDYLGKLWEVELVRVEDGFLLSTDWDEFFAHHPLNGTFARTHLPRYVQNVEIHDSSGHVWQIRVDTRHNGIVCRLAGEWVGYAWPRISTLEICVFEIINGGVSAFNVYKVAAGGTARTLL